MRESVLLDDVYVTSRDAAAGIDVVAKVGTGHGLEALRLTQICVATGYNSAGINIANQYSHCSGDCIATIPS